VLLVPVIFLQACHSVVIYVPTLGQRSHFPFISLSKLATMECSYHCRNFGERFNWMKVSRCEGLVLLILTAAANVTFFVDSKSYYDAVLSKSTPLYMQCVDYLVYLLESASGGHAHGYNVFVAEQQVHAWLICLAAGIILACSIKSWAIAYITAAVPRYGSATASAGGNHVQQDASSSVQPITDMGRAH
jgi:hypothetical protein